MEPLVEVLLGEVLEAYVGSLLGAAETGVAVGGSVARVGLWGAGFVLGLGAFRAVTGGLWPGHVQPAAPEPAAPPARRGPALVRVQ